MDFVGARGLASHHGSCHADGHPRARAIEAPPVQLPSAACFLSFLTPSLPVVPPKNVSNKNLH